MRASVWRAVVVLVTVGAAALRLQSIDFGLPDRYRPDEQYIVDSAAWYGGRRGFNPHFADYPAAQSYIVYGLGHAVQALRGEAWDIGDPSGVRSWYLTGRLATAVMGTLTVPLTAAVTEMAVAGSAAANLAPPAGALAATLLAGAFLHIRDSHFATTDVPATFWSMAAFLALTAVVRRRRLRDAALAGALIGLATATKYPSLVLAVPLVFAHLLASGGARWRHLAVSVVALAATFVAATPYVILDPTMTWSTFARLSSVVAGGGFPAPGGVGWLWGDGLPTGLGLPLVVLTALALPWALARGTLVERLLATGFVATAIPLVLSRRVFFRYTLPLIPLAMVLIAGGVARAGARRRAVGWAAAALALVALVPSLERALAVNRILAQDDTRTLARRWMEANLPAGTTVYAAAFGAEALPFALPPATSGVFRYAGALFGAPRGAYVLVAEHPLHHAHPPTAPLLAALRAGSTVLLDVNPFRDHGDAGNPPRYEQADALFVPLDGFESVERPGPRLLLYRLAP